LEPYSYVVQHEQPVFILVPVEDYEELVKADMVQDAFRNMKDIDNPNVKWVDAEKAALQFAGEQIAAARKKAGLTQKQLAAKLKVPQSQISRIVRNPDRTTVRTLKRIAKALRVDVRSLVR